jgi:RimJ/RimL family protein N-acetyltransferase
MLYFPLTHDEIHEQIAGLLNTYNNLGTYRTKFHIQSSKTKYVVETHGKFVIGVAGIEKVSYHLSELKHMVVHPDWRGKGLGTFVAKRALQISETPSIYATVRSTNISSIRALEKLDFVQGHEVPAGDHKLTLLTRAAPKWQKTNASKSNSSDEMSWINPIQGFME